MLPLFTLFEAKALDKRLIPQYGLDEPTLIDTAASLVFRDAYGFIEGKDVLFLVGKGNNGSDALEVARLSLGVARSVRVLLLSEEGNEENMRRRGLLPDSVYTDTVGGADTVIDGLFGFGFHGTLDERAKEILSSVSSSGAKVVAIDAPSAFSVKADLTVALTTMKKDFFLPSNRDKVGLVTLHNPGFPEVEVKGDGRSWLLGEEDYKPRRFNSTDYKNTRGHLLVAGGSDRYPGAPILTCRSAFHTGTGLVTLQSVQTVRDRVFAAYPSIMTVDHGDRDYSRYSSFAVGPGWDEGDRDALEAMAATGKPMVVDADALKLLSGMKFGWKAVITPHMGEYRRLKAILGIEDEDLFEEVKAMAVRLECVVVLKTSTVIISDGESIYVYDGSNPSLGVAGSGDTLTGMIGSFLASGDNPLTAATNGVILHQTAGRSLSRKMGFYMAEDLMEEAGRLR